MKPTKLSVTGSRMPANNSQQSRSERRAAPADESLRLFAVLRAAKRAERQKKETDELLWRLQPRRVGPIVQMSCSTAAEVDHLRSGCLTAGPLLLPGSPFTFDVSCCWTVEFVSVDDPTVAPGLTAGPFLFPGWPAIPVPELCALGAAETSGLVVCAEAGKAERASAVVRVITILVMALSSRCF